MRRCSRAGSVASRVDRRDFLADQRDQFAAVVFGIGERIETAQQHTAYAEPVIANHRVCHLVRRADQRGGIAGTGGRARDRRPQSLVVHVSAGREPYQAPSGFGLGFERTFRCPLRYAGQNRFGLLPGRRFGCGDDRTERNVEPRRAAVFGRNSADARNALGDCGARFAEQRIHVAVACTDTDCRFRHAAEPQWYMRLLRASHFGERAFESIVSACVIEWLVAVPHAPQHFEVLVGSSVALVVTHPVAVTALIGVYSAGDDVQPQSPPSEIVEGRGGTGGECRCHEAGAMRDEELQAFGLVRAVLRDLKPFCRRRGVADQHRVETGGFVRARERREELRIDAAADDVHGGLRRWRYADHSDDVERHGVQAVGV